MRSSSDRESFRNSACLGEPRKVDGGLPFFAQADAVGLQVGEFGGNVMEIACT